MHGDSVIDDNAFFLLVKQTQDELTITCSEVWFCPVSKRGKGAE